MKFHEDFGAKQKLLLFTFNIEWNVLQLHKENNITKTISNLLTKRQQSNQ